MSIFENRRMSCEVGPMKVKVTEEWRTLRNEELPNLASLTKINRVIDLRGMG